MECRASSGTRCSWLFFFFQAEDGIRDVAVTGVQTCALPISRQSRFWPMHDLLFRHQDGWAKLADPRPMLLALGDSAGADHARLAAYLRAHATAAEVQADAERARRAGAVSTPTFYIEGGLLEGNAPVEVFRSVLDSIYRSKTATPGPPGPPGSR